MRKIIVLISLLTIFSCGEKTTGVRKTVIRKYSPITLFDKVKIKIGMPKKIVEAKLAVVTNYKITTDKRSIRIALADSTNSYLGFNFDKKEKLREVRGVLRGETPELKRILNHIVKQESDFSKKISRPYDLGFLLLSKGGVGFNHKIHDSSFMDLNITLHAFVGSEIKTGLIDEKYQAILFKKVSLIYGLSKKVVKGFLKKLDGKYKKTYKENIFIVYFPGSKKSFFKLLFDKNDELFRIEGIFYGKRSLLKKYRRELSYQQYLREKRIYDRGYIKYTSKSYTRFHAHYDYLNKVYNQISFELE